jgi:serine/threonine protein kinase
MNWFVQLCFAVKYIYDRKILHRDLKLSNIFLCSNGDIKLGDFGISKVLDKSDEFAKTVVGTPYYLSPEICLKRPYNHKSDIWSLGCILYELMNMRHAFEASNIGELILKILKGDIDTPNKCFTEESINLIREMLTTDCEKRPDINVILEKPCLLKYIKMNVIKRMTTKQKTSITYEQDKYSSDSSETQLHLKYKSLPDSHNSVEKDNSSKEITQNELERDCNITVIHETKDHESTFTKIEKLKTSLEKFFGLENFLDIYFKISVLYNNTRIIIITKTKNHSSLISQHIILKTKIQ